MKPKADPLIESMDSFAAALLDEAKSGTSTAQAKLDTFKNVSHWIAVKNRLIGANEEGSDLDAFREQLRGDEPGPADRRKAGRRPALPKGHGGGALAAIKRKLPRDDDDGDVRGNSGDIEF